MTAFLVFACLTLPSQLRFDLGEFGQIALSDAGGPVGQVFVAVHGPHWEFASQRDTTALKVGSQAASGTIPLPGASGGQLRFEGSVSAQDSRITARYTAVFTGEAAIKGAYVIVSLPAERWKGRAMVIAPSMTRQRMPEKPTDPRFRGRASAVALDAGDGRWLIIATPSLPLLVLEDLRRFGHQAFELRYYLAAERVVDGQTAAVELTFAEVQQADLTEAVRRLAPPLTIDRSRPYAIVGEGGRVTVLVGGDTLMDISAGIHGLKWAFADQSACVWKTRYGDLRQRLFDGVAEVPGAVDKKLQLREMAAARDGGLQVKYRFHFPQDTPLNGYQVSAYLPVSRWAGAQLALDGAKPQRVIIPSKLEKPFIASVTVRAVRVVKKGFPTIQIAVDQPTELLVQDNRHWGADNVELRFCFLRAEAGTAVAAGTTTERTFTITSDAGLQAVLNDAAVTDAYDQSDWVPFTLPWDAAPIDLSWLNDKPAGKHGRLVVRDGHFFFEDRTPARFWGTCFSAGANFPTHQQAEIIARRLARFGVNIVRTHHADAYWAERNFFGKNARDTRHFDPEALDRFDYLIYCLKREGIYVYLDQLVNRRFTAADGVDAADKLPVCGKPYSNFDPKLIELQKEFSRKLWTHVNPYTGLAYKDDPAIVLMEFANENDLFSQPIVLEPYRSRLEQMYRQWARQRGVELPEGKIDFRRRTDALVAFFIDLQRQFYKQMRQFLRDQVGVRALMTGSNWSRNAALLAALEVCDYTDSHSYWNHPTRTGAVRNTSAMRAVSPLVGWLAFNRLAGKPFFVSEWNEPWHNEWRAEAPLFVAAVGALQQWDGLAIYTYAHTSERMPKINYLSGAFETFNDPALFGLFPHAALIFRRGDVRPAKEKWAIVVPEEPIAAADSLAPWMTKPLRGLPEVHQVYMALRRPPQWADRVVSPNDQPIADADRQLISDTGQLRHFPSKGYCVIDTPRTQAAMGFIGDAGDIAMADVRIRCRTDFATIAVSSMTNDPISHSPRLLITAVGRAENKGTRYDITHRMLVSRGTGPILCQPIEAALQIKSSRGHFTVYAIDADGRRRKLGRAASAGGTLRLTIGPQARTIYYELVAQQP